MTPIVQPLIGLGGMLAVILIIRYTFHWFEKPFRHGVV